MVVIFSPSPPRAKTRYISIVCAGGDRPPSLLQKIPRNRAAQNWQGLHHGGYAIRITSPTITSCKNIITGISFTYRSWRGTLTDCSARREDITTGVLSPLDGAVVAAVPASKRAFAYGDKMNQKSNAQLNEEIRVLKLKMGILENHVRKSGSDPDCVIIDGMFFANRKKRKTVDELVASLIEKRKDSGKLSLAVLNVRDSIKHAVPTDEQRGLTKEIRLSLARMELDGLVEVDGNSIKIK